MNPPLNARFKSLISDAKGLGKTVVMYPVASIADHATCLIRPWTVIGLTTNPSVVVIRLGARILFSLVSRSRRICTFRFDRSPEFAHSSTHCLNFVVGEPVSISSTACSHESISKVWLCGEDVTGFVGNYRAIRKLAVFERSRESADIYVARMSTADARARLQRYEGVGA